MHSDYIYNKHIEYITHIMHSEIVPARLKAMAHSTLVQNAALRYTNPARARADTAWAARAPGSGQ